MNNLVEKCTYSPEDNKLRIYVVDSDERFDDEVRGKLKDLGFIWAPLQKLYLAHWSPKREDFCAELGGQIVAEETTMLERAEAKSERLAILAEKRASESNAYSRAAQSMREKLASGQPVLAGHHSQRRVEKQMNAVERSQEQAVNLLKTANYWLSRAEGVEAHAIKKNDVRTRMSRIDTLFKELRDYQSQINHGYSVVRLWTEISEDKSEKREKLATYWAGSYMSNSRRTKKAAPSNLYFSLSNGEISVDDAIQKAITWGHALINNPDVYRWINHTLNRLAYEISAFGRVARYSGSLSDVVIKAFARKHGAESPICVRNNDGSYTLKSSVPLPLHISDGLELTLTDEQWRDLFVDVGYEVPQAKSKLPSIINANVKSVRVKLHGNVKELDVLSLTNKEFKAIYDDFRGVRPTACGNYRVRVCLDPKSNEVYYSRNWVVVFLNDSKSHPVPESDSFIVVSEE
ncbi:DUF3560 domain-containing protein [Vibrio cholerae]|uniref:DUF3560 domain-containing protein n=1 Tax=Vibrio cholerae TaxID=666 RepID=A0A7Z7VNJ9_VIBCL|nr:DUF3560 domain-containing protein [Vibrio cholerae]PNV68943.1 methyltransferase type 11 [Vibrio cholerae]TBM41312.1 DUF3560 domain-containing protein [Vibrio cholerae]